ncbi:MAG: lycopene cyclase family protein [Planctomycetota bacterium]|nr:lycopene cyclase family protein [Planctomycetota bacterium]
MPDLDVLVLGGGCAGLALALRLADAGGGAPRTHVVEARARYEDDRTWCFWSAAPHRFEGLIAASWNAFGVGHEGQLERYDCSATPYQMLPSLPYYEYALARIEQSDRVTLDLQVRVEGDPVREGDRWAVPTDHGVLRARHVVDTRPPAALPQAVLWQSFLGRVVRTAEPRFDAEAATLMDFAAPSSRGVQFTYVLPISDREALVETTVFGAQALGEADLTQDLDAALERLTPETSRSITRSEYGLLPMGLTARPTPKPWVQAGLFHGGARPSTGYAFQRIQTWAEACAEALLDGAPPLPAARDTALRRSMDAVFLRVLRSEPERGPALLSRLFFAAPTDRVIRFLSDVGSTADALAVVRSLPPGPFLRAVGAALLQTPQREVG